ncbi:hypothetical protein ABIE78_005661 [Sinorhizobium fredii]
MLDLAGERHVDLVSGSVPYLEMARHFGEIEDGDGNGKGERSRIAKIDQRMDFWQRSLLPEPPEQRLGGRAILRRLQPHAREGAAPSLDFG